MKVKLICFFIFIYGFAFSQSVFDYQKQFDSIAKLSKDSNSEMFYEKQLKKYLNNDKSQTDKEMLYLMIGYSATQNYKPYSDLLAANDIFKLNESGKYQTASDKAIKILNKNPFHLKVMIEYSYALTGLGKTDEADAIKFRMFKIYKAMYFSCNGNPNKYAVFELAPNDGQNFIKYYIRWQLGKISSGKDEYGKAIDIIEAKNDKQTQIFHFSINHAKKLIHKK